MLKMTLTTLAFAVNFTGAVQAADVQRDFSGNMRFWFGDRFTAQPVVRLNSDDPALQNYKQIGNFAIGGAPFSIPDVTLIYYAPIGAFKDATGEVFEGVIALPEGETKVGATCAFVGASTGNIKNIGDNSKNDRVIIHLSKSEIELIEETRCLAIQRRSQQMPTL